MHSPPPSNSAHTQHSVIALWAHQWRRKYAWGNVIIVRYADDSVCGLESEKTARRFLVAMQERFAKYGLALHAEKTRVIEFGRYARDHLALLTDAEIAALYSYLHTLDYGRQGSVIP